MRSRWVIGSALGLLCVPVLVDLLVSGKRRLFSYFAADAFYYLEVARNWAHNGTLSFDGQRATNGFHPAWQLLLSGAYRVGQALGLGDTAVLYVDLLLCLAFLALAIVLLGLTLQRAHGRLTPWFAFLPVGAYAIVLVPGWIAANAANHGRPDPFEGHLPLYGTLWSYVNGMESALAILAFATVAFVFVARPPAGTRHGVALGAALALLTFARLDLGLIAVSVLGALLVVAIGRRDRVLVRFTFVAAATAAIPISLYLVWNRAYAGAFLPTSGTLKSTFPRPTLGNARDLRELLTGNTAFALERVYRQGPVVISALVAIAALVWFARRIRRGGGLDLAQAGDRYRMLLAATAVGLLALAAYDWFFVPGFNQGHWYWPVSTLFVSLVALEWFSAIEIRTRTWSIAVVAVGGIVAIGCFVALGRPADYHRRFADFYFDEAPHVRAAYASDRPGLLAVDDGIDAFSLGFPSMSGTGLALDHAGVDAQKRGELVQLAQRRGFDHISSLVYFDASGLTPATPSDVVRAKVQALLPDEHLDNLDFRVQYVSAPGALSTAWSGNDGRYVIIAVTPRP